MTVRAQVIRAAVVLVLTTAVARASDRPARNVALDLFTLRPAPFYEDRAGRPAAFAAKGGIAVWAVEPAGLPDNAGAVKALSVVGDEAWARKDTPAWRLFATAAQSERRTGVPNKLDAVRPGARPGPLLVLFQAVPIDAVAGRYQLELKIDLEKAALSIPLVLRVLPFELPVDNRLDFVWDKSADTLSSRQYLDFQRLSFNRYASLLRTRAEEGAKSRTPLFFSLAKSALTEAASVPYEADINAPPGSAKALAMFLNSSLDSAGQEFTRSASPWDLRKWRAAWHYMRLCRAQAGFSIKGGLPSPEVKLDFAFLPETPPRRRPRVLCPLTGKPPVIDGAMNDKCWTQTGTIGDFERVLAAPEGDNRLTQIRFCRDEATLYLAVIGAGSPPEQLRLNLKPTDKVSFKREMVRVQLAPLAGSALECFIDPFGTCLVRTVGLAPYTGRPRAAVKRFETGWVAEVALPLPKTLVLENDWWTLRAERWIPGPAEALYRWPDRKRTGHEQGDFVFERPRIFVTRFDLPGPGIGLNALRVTVRNTSDAPITAEAFLAVQQARGKPLRFNYPLPAFPPGKYVRVEFPYKLDKTGPCSVLFFLRDKRSDDVLARIMRAALDVPHALTFEGQRFFTRETTARFLLNLDVTHTCMDKVILRLALSRPRSPKAFAETYVNAVKGRKCIVTVPLDQLADQTLTLSCAMTTGKEVLGKRIFSFAVMPHFLDENADGR